jgi:hypothetical protein
MFTAIVALLESGSLYGHASETDLIIAICHRAEQRCLAEYERHVAAICSRKGAG